jgi:hypothetical protein
MPIYVVRVACLVVEGNVAEIGGTIVSSPALPSQVGDAFTCSSAIPASQVRLHATASARSLSTPAEQPDLRRPVG